jgi:amino-acid N-acetyltransferase
MIVLEPIEAAGMAAARSLIHDAGLPLDGLGDVPTVVFGALEDDELVGVAALERYGEHGLLRSVAVAASRRGEGIGSLLVAAVERHAREIGLNEIYLLTDTAAAFFATRGYEVIARDQGSPAVMASIEWTVACGESAVPMVLR